MSKFASVGTGCASPKGIVDLALGGSTPPARSIEERRVITNIAFSVPGEPQGKGRAKIVKIGGFSRMATPAKTIAYEGLVATIAAQAMAGAAPFEGPVAVECDLLFSVPRSASKRARERALARAAYPTKKPDADNVLKAICDGMNQVVFRDDVQVVDVRMTKRFAATPGVLVRVACVASEAV